MNEALLNAETLSSFTISEENSFADATALRNFVFSTMPAGCAITRPYWFSYDTTFDGKIWKEYIVTDVGRVITRTIDFEIQLYNGSMLTDSQNKQLLDTFRYWIAYQVHPRFTGGKIYDPDYAHATLTKVLQTIDWIIINGERLEICERGLAMINENNLITFLGDVLDKPTSESIYQYSGKMSDWIKGKINEITDKDIERETSKHPEINYLPPKEDMQLSLSEDELIKARVWFFKHNFYYYERNAYVLRSSPIIATLYENTLNGSKIKPLQFEELNVGAAFDKTEFPQVEIRSSKGEGVSYRILNIYIAIWKRLPAISEIDCDIDRKAILGLTKGRVLTGRILAPEGRYRTAPIEVVLDALRGSIEFTIKYGDIILEEVFNTLEMRSKGGETIRSIFNANGLTTGIISSRAAELGVTHWSISRQDPEFYKKVRNNNGLAEMFQVLTGSIQIFVGAVMARRRDEMVDLDSATCIFPLSDPSLPVNSKVPYYLVFFGNKTGAAGEREILKRPIPLKAAIFLRKLSAFNERLISIGVLKSGCTLFQNVSRLDGSVNSLSRTSHYNNFNIACDYFELATTTIKNKGVRRYYIRQHQLRRFFALAFFWGTDNHDLETLSYMLGHTDARQFYRYVTESVSGRVLREAKANRIQGSLDKGANDIEGLYLLKDMLRKTYNAKQVHLKTYDEVFSSVQPLNDMNLVTTNVPFEEYMKSNSFEGDIIDFLDKGRITLEPEFMDFIDINGNHACKIHLVLMVKDIE